MSQPKLEVIQGKVYATSLDLAQCFHKSHDYILKAVRRTIEDCPKPFLLVNFDEQTRKNKHGKPTQIFHLTRDGFALVAMSFTGPKAMAWKVAYIEAFNAMESELRRRAFRAGQVEQLKLAFPEPSAIAEEIKPALSITAALSILAYNRLDIPLINSDTLRRRLKNGTLQGFHQGRRWMIYQESFNRFLELRKAA